MTVQTAYRPFNFVEAELMMNQKVKEVDTSWCGIITGVTRHAFFIGCELIPFERALTEFVTESGNPLGKLVIENKYRQ